MWLALAFLSAFLLGFYDVSKKYSLRNNAVIPILFLNTLFCSLIFLPLAFRTPFGGWEVQRYILLKACIVLSSWLLGYIGIKNLPITIVGPINATRPVMVLVGALIIFGERLNLMQWAGVLLAILSFFLLSRSGKKEGIDFKHNRWIYCTVAAAILGAISGLYDKYLMASESGLGLPRLTVQCWYNFYQCIMMGAMLLLLWWPKRKESTPFKWRWNILLISVFLSIAEAEPTDFMGKNFRYYSMCDWKVGMRFMVVPDKYDLLVSTFHDAITKKEVANGILRHRIMVYQGHNMLSNGRVHINFTCEEDGKSYYFVQPWGTFADYCYSKSGIPTLAYLGDVDKARELLMNQPLLTRTQHFRVDTEYSSDAYREITVDKNMLVTVKAIGVGTRTCPVKIIVEDENGNQFYQNVAMSKTNSGLRDESTSEDADRYSFAGSFEFLGANMTVSSNIREYLNQTVHTKYSTSMSSKGSGKVRDVKVPRFTGFIIDEITPVRNSKY